MQTLPAPLQPTPPLPDRPRAGLSLDDAPRRGRNTGLQRIAATLYRFRWFLPIPVALGVGAGFLAARQARPEYAARSTIWIDASGGTMGMSQGGPLRSPELLQSRAWVELLRSYTVLDPVVRTEKLYLTYGSASAGRLFADFQLAERFRPGEYRLSAEPGGRYRLATRAGATMEVGRLGGAVGANVGFRWHPDAALLRRLERIDFTVVTPRDAAVRLAGELVTGMGDNGNFLRLELRGTEPARITSTLNTLTDRYVQVAGDLKRSRLQELERILGEQLGYAAGSLAREEAALQGFRVRTITLPTDRGSPVTPGLEVTQNPVLSNFFSLNMEREQIQRDRDDLARALSQDAATVSTVEAIPSVQKSSALVQALSELTQKRAEERAMSGQFTDLYVPLQRLREQVRTLERQTIPTLSARLDAELAGRQHAIDGLIQSASTQLRGIPPRAIEEARLTRRVEIAQDLYKLLQQRHEEARLAAVTTIPDVRVLDRATEPYSPVRDPRLQLILLFSLAGLAAGVLGAMLYDRANPRLAYPEQVTEGLGLPILGAIPRARSVGAGARASSVSPELPEAFRALRLGLVHASGTAGPLVVTITSPGSGDGKSFVSANLALTFAEQGHRVLLIDADLRRGTLHRVLGVERKPGLSDYLAGNATRADVVQRTPYEGVHMIAGGTRAGRGPELLSTPAMAELLADLRSAYRVILIDSPPIGACVDPLVLATLSRDMLMVLRNGATDRQLAEWNLDLVDRLPIRVLGAVINGIAAKGAYRAYRYLKGYDYQALPEDSTSAPRLQPVA
ncbi:MAG TPA: polysaccharide biosynthesis tyrosine autokinase [Longimicrobium sp.]